RTSAVLFLYTAEARTTQRRRGVGGRPVAEHGSSQPFPPTGGGFGLALFTAPGQPRPKPQQWAEARWPRTLDPARPSPCGLPLVRCPPAVRPPYHSFRPSSVLTMLSVRRLDSRQPGMPDELQALRDRLSPRGDVVSEASRERTVPVFGPP